jgi:hypothetical protein
VCVALLLPAWASHSAQDTASYRAVVEQFRSAPAAAVRRLLDLPSAGIAEGVREASAPDSFWATDAIDRALLMHGDAAASLSVRDANGAEVHVRLARDLAIAATRRGGNEWFVHRWFRVSASGKDAAAMDAHWRQQTWHPAAAAIDRARELETAGVQTLPDNERFGYDTRAFREAIPLLEQGVLARFPVAALRLGRLQLLRGNDIEAGRLLAIAAADQSSRVNRYLANLFLGAMTERFYVPGAEDHYRKALAALPGAQSGRLALAALLERTGRADEARRVLQGSSSATPFDPWWSYFRGTDLEKANVLAELHAEVCQ